MGYTLGMTAITSRQRAALELVTSGALDTRIWLDSTHRLIPSGSVEGAFYVTSRTDCTCPDYRYRGGACKHMTALRVQATLDEAERLTPINRSNGRLPVAERED